MVLNHNNNVAVAVPESNLRRRALGMPMNIRKAFLHHAKNGRLHLTRQTAEIVRNFKVNFNLAALGESIYIPSNRRD